MCKLEHNVVWNHQQIAMPKIGSGLAGGDWTIISAIIEDAFVTRDVYVYVL